MRVLSILSVALLATAGAAAADPGSPPPAQGGGWGAGGWNGAPARGQYAPPPGHPPIGAGQLPPPGHPPVIGAGDGQRPDRGHRGRKGRWYGGRGTAGGNYYFAPGGPFGGGYYYVPQPAYGYDYPDYSAPAYSYPAPVQSAPQTYINPTGPITVPAGTTVIVKVTPTVTKTVTEEWVYPKAHRKSHWRGKTKLRHR